jgi:hypothetical protein
MPIEKQTDWVPLLRHQLQQGSSDARLTANQAAFAIGTTELVLAIAEELSMQSTGERFFVVLYLGLNGRPDLVSLLDRLQVSEVMRASTVNLDFVGHCCNALLQYMAHNRDVEASAVLTKITSWRKLAKRERRSRMRNDS